MKKPRILFITPLPPPVHGSGMVSQYIKDSKLIQGEFECDFVNLSTSRNIDEIGNKSYIKYVRLLKAFIKTFVKLLRHRYSLCCLSIKCHHIGFLKDAPFVLLCKLFRRRIVLLQHNKGMSSCINNQPYRWLIPIVYKNTKVILLSWKLYPDIEKVVKSEQVFICPNGIPALSDEEPTLERNNAVLRLLFLSNLIEDKGVYVLLDACKILKEKGYKFTCDFVGNESKEINKNIFEEQIINRRLNNIVTYHGPKYGEEKVLFFEHSDIFVFPTQDDAFPLVLLEAMQYKLPIVTTNEGGIPDIVTDGENGYICEQKNAESLASAIEKLIIDKPLREKMGNKGYNIYKEKFTLKSFENTITEILKQCI